MRVYYVVFKKDGKIIEEKAGNIENVDHFFSLSGLDGRLNVLRSYAILAKKRTLLSWSSGKDSAWTLYVLRHGPTIEVMGLLSALNERFNRVPEGERR